MFPIIFSNLVILALGYVIPAYHSYKAVKNKDAREYARLMMYWVVFATFVTITTITDMFIFWLPLYYELKVLIVAWMSTPYTQGSTFLYRRLLHPELVRHEPIIESSLENIKAQGFQAFFRLVDYLGQLALFCIATGLRAGQQRGFINPDFFLAQAIAPKQNAENQGQGRESSLDEIEGASPSVAVADTISIYPDSPCISDDEDDEFVHISPYPEESPTGPVAQDIPYEDFTPEQSELSAMSTKGNLKTSKKRVSAEQSPKRRSARLAAKSKS